MSERSRTTNPAPEETGESQLRLLPGGSAASRPEWELDEKTRSLGRLGVAQAREALRRAKPPEPKHPEPVRKAS